MVFMILELALGYNLTVGHLHEVLISLASAP
jgi:hypothetical protein